MSNIKNLANELVSLSIKELNELAKLLKEEHGIEPVAPAVVAAPAAAAAAPKEEQNQFDVILTAAGNTKLQVIKVIRDLTGLQLKDAKELIDGAPQPVKTGIDKAEAQKMKTELEAVGATVELK